MDNCEMGLVGLISSTLAGDRIVFDRDHSYVLDRVPSFNADRGYRHETMGLECISVALPRYVSSENLNNDYCAHTARGCDVVLVRLPKFGSWVMYAYDIKETWTTKDAGFIDANDPVIELNDRKSERLGVYGPFEVPSGLRGLL